MRGYIKSFLMVCTLCVIVTARAEEFASQGKPCGGTIKCAENLYCESNTSKCVSCSDKTDGTHPNSDAESTAISACYKNCLKINVTLGTKEDADQKAFFRDGDKECKYTLTCVENAEELYDNSACKCKPNYEGTTSCTAKCYNIELVKNLTNVLENSKFLSVRYDADFYKEKDCSEDNKLDTESATGWQTPTIKWWQTFNGYSTSENGGTLRFGSDGRPTIGTTTTTFTDNTKLYGQWNGKTYTIDYYIDGTIDGTRQNCRLVIDSNTPTGDNCKARQSNKSKNGREIIGWSKTDGATTVQYNFGADIPAPTNGSADNIPTIKLYAVWAQCQAGHYCDASGKHNCPAGATSAEGATTIDKCYISRATQFQDSLGSFTLPIGNINYSN